MIRAILSILTLSLMVGCGQQGEQPTSEGEAAEGQSTGMQQQEEQQAPESSEGEGDASSEEEGEESSEQSQAEEPTELVENLDADAAAKLLEKQSDIIVLDVRTAKEYNSAHIEGAKNLDFYADGFQKQLASLDKDEPYLVHCASGGRSSKARDLMQKLGFKKIFHLEGGMNAWQKAGNPVVE